MVLQNGETLAYLGDAIFELFVREYLIRSGMTSVKKLHEYAIKYSSGTAQSQMVKELLEKEILSEEELAMYKHGRNANHSQNRRKIQMADYKMATGFEALLGHLYLLGKAERMTEIMRYAISVIEEVLS